MHGKFVKTGLKNWSITGTGTKSDVGKGKHSPLHTTSVANDPWKPLAIR